MTAYVDCTECGGRVPWYYAWLYGPSAMHPGCALDRIDEEGCGASWFLLTRTAQDCRTELQVVDVPAAWCAITAELRRKEDQPADQTVGGAGV